MVFSLSHDVILIVIVNHVNIVEAMMFPLHYVMDMLCFVGLSYGIMMFLDICVEYNLHSAEVKVRVLCLY